MNLRKRMEENLLIKTTFGIIIIKLLEKINLKKHHQ